MTHRAVRVAVIDSGVHATHPHVGGVAGGIGIDDAGRAHDDYVDRLGHGTAVTAAIREKAPAAEIFAIKVFDRELAATGVALVAAFERAIEQGAHIINLSLGTQNADHETSLAGVVREARAARCDRDRRGRAGRRALAARRSRRRVAGAARLVGAARGMPRDRCGREATPVFHASGFPRPIPGVPPERTSRD